jgi:plasmid maintenance system antidote protein VapI
VHRVTGIVNEERAISADTALRRIESAPQQRA